MATEPPGRLEAKLKAEILAWEGRRLALATQRRLAALQEEGYHLPISVIRTIEIGEVEQAYVQHPTERPLREEP